MVNPEQQVKSTMEKLSQKEQELLEVKKQLKRVEEKYRLSKEKHDLYIKNSPDMLCEVDFNGPRFIRVNDTLCEKLGYTREELLSSNPMDFLYTDSKKEREKIINKFNRAKISSGWIDYTCRTKEGRMIGQVHVIANYQKGKLVTALVVAHDITELKLTEKSLLESEAQLRSILDNSRDVIIRINLRTRKYEFVSSSVADLIGYQPEEIMSMDEVTILKLVHPDDLSTVKEAQKIAEETGKAEAEYRLLTKDGDYVWISNLMSVEKDSTGRPLYRFNNMRNINHEKKAENALKESKLRYKTLVDTLSDAILVQRNYKIKYANTAALKLFHGRSKDELLGESIFKLIPEEMHEITKKRIKQAAVRQTPPIEYEFIRLDGSTFYGEITSKNILYQNKTATQIVIRDISRQKRAEEHQHMLLDKQLELTEKLKISNKSMKHVQGELRETIKKLENSNKELEQFAYVASHDLQEPLRMVSSFSQLLERKCEDQLDEDSLEYIEFIVDGAHRMKDLIDDLLAFSRLKTKAEPFELVNMETTLNIVLSNLERTITETKAQVTHDTLPDVMGDPSQIIQLLQNLISNALKFHDDHPPQINISVEAVDDMWKIGISDKGIGIPEQHHEKIFEVFRRLHTLEEYPGTGIGLAICKRIVARHNGRIWLKSEIGKGTTFYFTIPRIGKTC